MADTSTRISPQTSSPSKHKRIVPIAIVGAIILLLLLAVSYIGVLSPSKLLPSRDSSYYAETSSISLEVKHGDFSNAESSLRRAVSEAGATIYRESVKEYSGSKSAYFTIDVLDNAADNLINKLRTIGDVKSFSYSKGKYERNYGTDGLQQGYVRITVSLVEKKSVFSSFNNLEANALGSTFSGSIVALFYFIVAVLPWAVVILVIYFLIRYIRRKLSD